MFRRDGSLDAAAFPQTASTTVHVDSRDRVSGNASAFTVDVPELHNVSSARVITAELPLACYAVSSARENASMTVTVDGVTETVTVPDGNHTTESLTAALKTSLDAAFDPIAFVGAPLVSPNGGYDDGPMVTFSGGEYFYTTGAVSCNVASNGGFTVVAVVRFATSSDWGRIIDFGQGAASDNIFFGRIGGSDELGVDMYNGPSVVASLGTTTAPIVNGEWMTVACRYVASTGEMTIHKNGTVIAAATVAPGIVADRVSASNRIGASNWPDPNFEGDMAGVLVYDRALSDGDIDLATSFILQTTSAVPPAPVVSFPHGFSQFTVTVDPVTMKTTITRAGGTVSVSPGGLASRLGFDAPSTPGSSITGSGVADLSPERYLMLHVDELDGLPQCATRGRGGRRAFAKIPLKGSSYSYNISDAPVTHVMQRPQVPKLNRLHVALRYHDGGLVDLNGAEWSFSLEAVHTLAR